MRDRFVFLAVGELLFYATGRTHRAPGIYSRCEGFQTASWPSHLLIVEDRSELLWCFTRAARQYGWTEQSRLDGILIELAWQELLHAAFTGSLSPQNGMWPANCQNFLKTIFVYARLPPSAPPPPPPHTHTYTHAPKFVPFQRQRCAGKRFGVKVERMCVFPRACS